MRTNGAGPAAAMAATLMVWARVAAAQPANEPMEPGVTFSAEVTIAQAIVDRSGTPTRELPTSRYRLEQLESGGLRTVMLATRRSPARGALADAYAGLTVDTDPATGALRVRDAQGSPLATPGAPIAALPEPGESSLIVAPAERAGRLAALARQFGPPQGSVRAFQRYLARRGRVVEELLVAPDTAAPVELNRIEDGVLVEHHVFEYAPIGDGRQARVRTRSESSLPRPPGSRLVAVTTLSAIRVKGAGQ